MIVSRLGTASDNDTMGEMGNPEHGGSANSETKWLFTERDDVATLYQQQATRDSASEPESKTLFLFPFWKLILENIIDEGLPSPLFAVALHEVYF